MSSKIHILEYLEKSRNVLTTCITDADFNASILLVAEEMYRRLKDGKKILSIGNGGSMSDATHFAAELSGRYKHTRQALAALALSDSSVMSCIANDFGYENIFSRQINAIGQHADVLFALSTSGKSISIINAMQAAQRNGMVVIAMTGVNAPMDFMQYCDLSIKIPSSETGRIQEISIMVIHLLVEIIESKL